EAGNARRRIFRAALRLGATRFHLGFEVGGNARLGFGGANRLQCFLGSRLGGREGFSFTGGFSLESCLFLGGGLERFIALIEQRAFAARICSGLFDPLRQFSPALL